MRPIEQRSNAGRGNGTPSRIRAQPDPPSAREQRTARTSVLRSAETARLAVYLVAGLFIRLLLMQFQYVINTDGVFYAWLGRRLVSGQPSTGLSTYWPPFYPFLLGLASLAVPDLEFAGRLVSVLCGSLVIIPAYLLVRESYGRRAASLAAVLVAVYPELTAVSTLVMTEATYTLILTSAVVVSWRAARNPGSSSALLSGLLFGLAYLTRPEALCYVPLVLIAMWSTAVVRGHSLGTLLRKTLLFTLTVGICAAPYVLFLHRQTGSWTISQKLLQNAPWEASGGGGLRLTEDGQWTPRDLLYADAFHEAARARMHASGPIASGSPAYSQTVAGQPSPRASSFARHFVRRLKSELREYMPQIFPPLFMAVALIGLMRQPWSARRLTREFYLTMFVAASLVGYALTVLEVRYLVPVLPILLGWVAKGILELESWSMQTAANLRLRIPGGRRGVSIAVLVLLIASRAPSLAYPWRVSPWKDLPLEQKITGLWIREHGPSSALIMASGPWAAYYANGRHLYLPEETASKVLDEARRKDVDYLIVDERSRGEDSLGSLLSGREPPSGFRLVYENRDDPGHQVRVFEPTVAAEPAADTSDRHPPVAW